MDEHDLVNARPKVPCAYCGEPVHTKDYGEWVMFGPIVNVHLEDGRHFHTDCYQVHLIEESQQRHPRTGKFFREDGAPF